MDSAALTCGMWMVIRDRKSQSLEYVPADGTIAARCPRNDFGTSAWQLYDDPIPCSIAREKGGIQCRVLCFRPCCYDAPIR
jgi:hypothetical protein